MNPADAAALLDAGGPRGRSPGAQAAFVFGWLLAIGGLFVFAAATEGEMYAWRLARMADSATAPEWIKENRREDLYFAFGGSVESVVWACRAWCEATLITAVCFTLFLMETGRRRFAAPMQVLAGLLFMFVAIELIKFGVPRTRPINFEGGDPWPASWMLPADISWTDYKRRSFPSTHAAAGLTVSSVLFALYPRLGWVVIPLGAAGAASRFMTLSHWPTDIIVGSLIGWLAGLLATRVLRPLWVEERGALAPVIRPAAAPPTPTAAPVAPVPPPRPPAEVSDPGF